MVNSKLWALLIVGVLYSNLSSALGIDEFRKQHVMRYSPELRWELICAFDQLSPLSKRLANALLMKKLGKQINELRKEETAARSFGLLTGHRSKVPQHVQKPRTTPIKRAITCSPKKVDNKALQKAQQRANALQIQLKNAQRQAQEARRAHMVAKKESAARKAMAKQLERAKRTITQLQTEQKSIQKALELSALEAQRQSKQNSIEEQRKIECAIEQEAFQTALERSRQEALQDQRNLEEALNASALEAALQESVKNTPENHSANREEPIANPELPKVEPKQQEAPVEAEKTQTAELQAFEHEIQRHMDTFEAIQNSIRLLATMQNPMNELQAINNRKVALEKSIQGTLECLAQSGLAERAKEGYRMTLEEGLGLLRSLDDMKTLATVHPELEKERKTLIEKAVAALGKDMQDITEHHKRFKQRASDLKSAAGSSKYETLRDALRAYTKEQEALREHISVLRGQEAFKALSDMAPDHEYCTRIEKLNTELFVIQMQDRLPGSTVSTVNNKLLQLELAQAKRA